MVAPTTRYAQSGDSSIAYQVVGEGPFDLVVARGWVSHLEVQWELPIQRRWLERLASFSRLILFDKRGTGVSDRVAIESLPTMEERVEDMLAVLDAAESERAAVVGFGEGGALAALLAAAHPERATALALYELFISGYGTPGMDEAIRGSYPFGDAADADTSQAGLEKIAPSLAGDPAFRDWWARLTRLAATPATVEALRRMDAELDVSAALPAINCPTIVLHRVENPNADEAALRAAAAAIPRGRYVELPGRDHLPYAGDADALVDEIQEFLTGTRGEAVVERILATVLFTDVVGSTEKAAELGDRRWSELLEAHRAVVRRELELHRGREVDVVGDGFLAAFDGPARAIRCAVAVAEASASLGAPVRAGVHTGECELVEGRVAGIAVHIGARVAARARAGEVLVSRTVKDLVAGSGIEFAPAGSHELKGVPGTWEIHRVEHL
jgi:class 3 adenylate cyclase/dienelactone hydrolase